MKKRARRPRENESRSRPHAAPGRPRTRASVKASGSSSRTRTGTRGARSRDRASTPISATADRIVHSQPWHLLAPELRKAGAEVVATTDNLKRYAKLLIEWNRGVSNLISRNDEARIVERHLVESLA